MKKVRLSLFVTVMGVILYMSGSEALAFFNDYGSISARNNVTQAFESYKPDPNLNYYICGSDLYPDALIGINKAYTLDDPLWKEVELAPKVLKNLISNMQFQATSGLPRHLMGYAILDDKGHDVGVWYSRPWVPTFVKMENEQTVHIQTARPSFGHGNMEK
jgi:hypothetical protein